MSKKLHDVLYDVVRASNAIEGIYAQPGEPLFDNHLQAVELVRRLETMVSPHEIHQVLMRGILVDAGQTRRCHVSIVGSKTGEVHNTMPNPERLPMLLDDYFRLVLGFWQSYKSGALPADTDLEQQLFDLHSHGLCIHPFSDGNGRTFRIFWNQLRLMCGLSWMTIQPANLDFGANPGNAGEAATVWTATTSSHPPLDYVGMIRAYEDNVFRKMYPRVY